MEEKPISIELPNNIECAVESTDAAIKNQTASSSYKPALLDCGIKIDVPPFIESGEKNYIRYSYFRICEESKLMGLNSPQYNLMYKACLKASKVLIRDFGEIEKLQVSEKGPGDFVTASDKRVEKILINELEKTEYSLLTEESGFIKGKDKNKRWIIDPIDGTFNFLNSLPHFAISVAYEENGEVISGIIFDPIKNEMFFCRKR